MSSQRPPPPPPKPLLSYRYGGDFQAAQAPPTSTTTPATITTSLGRVIPRPVGAGHATESRTTSTSTEPFRTSPYKPNYKYYNDDDDDDDKADDEKDENGEKTRGRMTWYGPRPDDHDNNNDDDDDGDGEGEGRMGRMNDPGPEWIPDLLKDKSYTIISSFLPFRSRSSGS